MKHPATLLLLFVAVGTFAQSRSTTPDKSDVRRLKIGLTASPELSYRSLHNNDGRAETDQRIASVNDFEIPKLGYSFGLNVGYDFKDYFGLEIGIHYSNKGYQTRNNVLILTSPNEPIIADRTKMIWSFHYIDVPLKANFRIGKGSLRFITSLGVTTGFFINETLTQVRYYSYKETEKQSDTTSNLYKSVMLSPTISVGVDWAINERMSLRTEPTFKYGLVEFADRSDLDITSNLYSIGLNVGYYVGF